METREFVAPAGVFVGAIDEGIVRVLGLRYATAGRFEPPRDVSAALDPGVRPATRQALTPAPASPQNPSPVMDDLLGGLRGVAFSEDCQALSVTLPADVRSGELLPVMVWVHGGGYTTGAGDLDLYDPQALVLEQRVVVVSVTYRLGVLGFFGDGRAIQANLGLLDLVSALRWVHANIEAFSGARDCVTLFGQSSGADMIAHLMICEGTAGLFRRVILQSAPLGAGRRREPMVRAMLRATGTLPHGAPIASLLELQKRAERAARRFGIRGGMAFGVQYGHDPLPPAAACDSTWRDAAPSVDLLIGTTTDETALYVPLLPGIRHSVRSRAFAALVKWLLVRPTTYLVYVRPARRFVVRHRAAGGRAVLYRLSWTSGGSRLGAVHMCDVPLLLGTFGAWRRTSLVGGDDWSAIADAGRSVRRLWADFARTGVVAVDRALDGGMTFDRARGPASLEVRRKR